MATHEQACRKAIFRLICAWFTWGLAAAAQAQCPASWAQAHPAQSPGPRSAHAMAYDSVRQRVVLFGGVDDYDEYFGDTWEWDGTSWTLRATGGPAPRAQATMVYDEARGVTLLFGGFRGGFIPEPPFFLEHYYGDTWAWDGSTWTRLATSGPTPRQFHAMAYDAGRERAVIFGGESDPFTLLRDTWEWDGQSWAQVSGTGPAARRWATMAYDPARSRTVLFGGSYEADLFVLLNDTWEWDGASWSLRSNSGPVPRDVHAMAFDTDRSRVVLFGGFYEDSHLADTWEWNGQSWALRATGGPPERGLHAMAYDSARQRMVLFGGDDFEPLGDTWTLAVSGAPTIGQQPQDQAAPQGGTASLTVGAAGNSLAYRWRKDGVDLINGPSPGGSVISGATTATLTISGVQDADAGGYSCWVTNACGSVASAAASLTVTGSGCPADWNSDEMVNSNDISAFLTAWLDSVQMGNLIADFNGDTAVNSNDISAFLTAWLGAVQGGC